MTMLSHQRIVIGDLARAKPSKVRSADLDQPASDILLFPSRAVRSAGASRSATRR
jgi:hypothetical protein